MRKLRRFFVALLIISLMLVVFGLLQRGGLPSLGEVFSAVSGFFLKQKCNAEFPAPDIDADADEYKLVNRENLVSPDFYVKTAYSKDGYLFDSRAVGALDDMLDAGRAKGMQLVLTSGYRTYDYQNTLFEAKIESLMAESGKGRAEAEAEAETVVARPGASEHNIGLAADIVSQNHSILDESYADTEEAVWLRENCADYGFILRYTAEKQHITGIISEPWHFRYVGVEAARYIMDNGICLEEFLAIYREKNI